jgi:hypothetical protein
MEDIVYVQFLPLPLSAMAKAAAKSYGKWLWPNGYSRVLRQRAPVKERPLSACPEREAEGAA